jgi:hypothetical protein
LQTEFLSNHPGFVIAEMAKVFWDEYNESGSIRNSCSEAVRYVKKHKAFLSYIGDSHHGEQSHVYKPVDVCPFQE